MNDMDRNELERRARELHEEAVEQLDPDTLARLATARRLALDEASQPAMTPTLFGKRWAPAALTAGLGSLAVAWLLLDHQREPANVIVEGELADDIEILLAGENLELLENLDFYLWLTMQPDAG
ncbi:MAG: hypothetical protein ACR2QR_08230 [Woeseiaceae bacterium]